MLKGIEAKYKMKVLNVILEFLLYSLLLSLLGTPLLLIVLFPSEAEYYVRFAETMVPWGVALFLAAIFSGGIKSLFSKLVETLSRVKSMSAAGAAIELNPQEIGEADISKEKFDLITQHVQELTQVNKDTINLAGHFFVRYVGTTIYGSQFRLLEAIEGEPMISVQALNYYNQFITSAPELADYKFESWMEYLVNNLLIRFDSENNNYVITDAGKLFLLEIKKLNFNPESFKY